MAERICCGCNRATVDAKPWRGLYVCDDCRNLVGIPPAVRAELKAARRVLRDEYRPHWEARNDADDRLRRLLGAELFSDEQPPD